MIKMYGGVNYIGKSDEPKPTTGVKAGETLYEVDTKKSYIYYSGQWYEV
jgi:hypothetical protein